MGFARLVRLSIAIEDAHIGGGSNSDRWTWARGEFIPTISLKPNFPEADAHSKSYSKAVIKELTETLKEALGELEFLRLVASTWVYTYDEGELRNSLTTENLQAKGVAAGNGWSAEAWEAILTHNQSNDVDTQAPNPNGIWHIESY